MRWESTPCQVWFTVNHESSNESAYKSHQCVGFVFWFGKLAPGLETTPCPANINTLFLSHLHSIVQPLTHASRVSRFTQASKGLVSCFWLAEMKRRDPPTQHDPCSGSGSNKSLSLSPNSYDSRHRLCVSRAETQQCQYAGVMSWLLWLQYPELFIAKQKARVCVYRARLWRFRYLNVCRGNSPCISFSPIIFMFNHSYSKQDFNSMFIWTLPLTLHIKYKLSCKYSIVISTFKNP